MPTDFTVHEMYMAYSIVEFKYLMEINYFTVSEDFENTTLRSTLAPLFVT